VALDPDAAAPLYRQLYDGLRDAVLSSRLAPGARLPSSRVLAADLGVARNTVLQAFDQLRSEGYLVGRRGGGSRVPATMPDALLAVAPSRRGRPGVRRPALPTMPRLSKRGSLLIHSGTGFMRWSGSSPVPFELGISAMDAFPIRLWARVAGRCWRRQEVDLGDADPAGERPLREAIASYLATARDARCTADQVLVMNGAQQALHLVAQVLLDPGEAAWIEDPGYVGARMAFEAAGARLVPVPVDDEGLDVGAGEQAAPEARLAYVTPSHQFPLGVLMSAPRRLQLLGWARRASAWIVEDDYDSEFRYAGRPLPCLQGLDAEASHAGESPRVLYVGTFSKTLVPGLRLGYLVVPEELVDAFRAVRSATDRHTPTPEQGVLADFIGEGHYARHIRQVRNLCGERQAALLAAAESRLAGLLTLAPDPAGLHLVGRLRAGLDERRAAELAAAEGVRVSPLSRFTIGERSRSQPGALLLSYAAYDERQIREGVESLGRALERA
jgi:GntR family transcriptional regulator/MocR family aminotransferase